MATEIIIFSGFLGAGKTTLLQRWLKEEAFHGKIAVVENDFGEVGVDAELLRSGNIYAVIGLPANLFYNTSIPTCIIVLKKHRDGRDVLFIDASKKFNKGKKQNEMTDAHIDEVLALYSKRETVEGEAVLASFDEIEKNDFNLNIPRYVDNFEKEVPRPSKSWLRFRSQY